MDAADIWVVVPIKPFATAKQRLAGALTPAQRPQLARLMAEDVLETLAACRGILAGVLVITADAEAAALAEHYGVKVLREPAAAGINQALTLAANALAGSGMIVVPADLPHISAAAIEQLTQLIASPRAVAMVRATNDGGTNILALRPAGIIPPLFGPDSFARHHEAARTAAVSAAVFPEGELGRDIDRPDDLGPFMDLRTATRTHAFLSGLRPPRHLNARQRLAAELAGPAP
jgi:2-phospho-L-lactate guanylyltransferase